MSPSYRHEKPNLRLGLIVVTLVEELGLRLVSARSTTIRREQAEQGLEPDDCFYVAHAETWRRRGGHRLCRFIRRPTW